LKDKPMPIILEVEWKFSSFIAPKNWKLIYEDRTVADLNLRSRFRWDFEGQFDGIPIIAEYRSKTDQTTIINKLNNGVIGIIDNMNLLKSKFTLKDGSVFFLELNKNIGYVLFDGERNIIGYTTLNLLKTPISFKFTYNKDDCRLMSPWFVALITFYYALVHGGGTMAA